MFAESAATPPIPDLGLRIDDLLAERGNASIPPDIRAFYDNKTRDTQGRITFQLYRVGAIFCLLLGALDYSVLPFALFLWMLLFRAMVSLSLVACGYLFARNTLGRFAPALLVSPHVLAIALTGIFGFMSDSDILFERYMIIAFFAVLVAVGFVRTNIGTSLWMAGLPLLVFTGCMLYSPIDPFAGRLQIILFMGCAAGGVLYGRHVQNQQLARLFLLNTREELRNADAIRLNAQLSSFAYTDQLTNIPNRRYFDEICATMGSGSNALLPLAVCFIDIDHFKNLNDELGHLRGDRCLRVVAAAISSNLRGRSDILARYGGEEFVLLLPATEITAALEVAERVRKAVLELNHDNPGSTLGVVSVSIGVAAISEPPMQIDALIAAADRALYRAKNNGRNLVSL
jgi:diguanylate cyclase (GGDEF)-like protein